MGKNALTRESTDAGAIREFLLATLDRQMSERYGSELTLPLQIQLESAKQRLSRAAEVQAALRSNGWVIDPSFIEWGFELVLNGISVRGTIDRIDRHESTGAIRVIDYKTSDKSLNPCEAHIRNLKRSESPNDVPEFALFEIDGRTVVWKDLQLPLYLRALGGEFSEKIECGYFNLPKATTETSFAFWENYTAEIQESADRCALGIVDAVKAGRFWPPSEDVDGTYDEFSVLFQHGAGDSVNWKAGTSK
jgi:ATP-dependent helicase/nuclease subunit B